MLGDEKIEFASGLSWALKAHPDFIADLAISGGTASAFYRRRLD